MELTTAVRRDMDLTVVLHDYSELGKISKEHRAGHFDVWRTALVNPDFAGAFAHRGPSLGHVHADVTLA